MDSIGKEITKSGYGHLYKNTLQVGMLGLVDDSICISEAGYKAQKMSVAFNTRTAEKTLQFRAKKCKSMLVGRNVETIHQNRLSTSWE